jgi:hypothetical protein
MREDQQRFLSLLGQLPARLTAEQVAWVLNCQPHDVPILVAARLLKPLGNPPPNSVKFFAALELLELVEDRTWLAKVTNALNQHWQKKNAAKKNGPTNSFVKPLVISASQTEVAKENKM